MVHTQILLCPSQSPQNPVAVNYGYSSALGGERGTAFGAASNAPIALAAINRPSETFMLFDDNSWYTFAVTPGFERSFSSSPTLSVQVAPHLDGSNVAYADGHVKWRSISAMRGIAAGGSACDLTNPDYTQAYCNRNYNPYVP